MRRIAIGCLVVIVLGLVVALCVRALDDDEIEIEEGRIEAFESSA